MEQNAEIIGERAGFTAHCAHCRQEQTFIHARLSTRKHLCLTILTLGLWSIIWIALLIGKSLRPWRCQQCGWHKPEFRTTTRFAS